MPDLKDYHAFKSTQGSNGGSGGGKIIIILVTIMLVYFIFAGASWEAIETLLSLGLIAFFLARWLFR